MSNIFAMFRTTSVLVLGLVLLVSVSGHRYGADIQACDSLVPGHSGTRRQESDSPYRVETNIPGYVPCATNPIPGQPQQCGTIVRIRSVRQGVNAQFKGFLIQARARINGQMVNVGEFRYMNERPILAGNNQNLQNGRQNPLLNRNMGQPRALGQVQRNPNVRMPPGQFNPQLGGNVNVQRLNCPRGFTVTHTENMPKSMVMMKWYAPAGFNDQVQFVGTVVRDFNTYWTGHRSLMLKPRPGLQVAVAGAQTGTTWYSSATRATPGGMILLAVSSAVSLFLMLL